MPRRVVSNKVTLRVYIRPLCFISRSPESAKRCKNNPEALPGCAQLQRDVDPRRRIIDNEDERPIKEKKRKKKISRIT